MNVMTPYELVDTAIVTVRTARDASKHPTLRDLYDEALTSLRTAQEQLQDAHDFERETRTDLCA